ncbi:hypothetical protein DV735_g1286, partial [Chaetothyriales sp. CBS 134920]
MAAQPKAPQKTGSRWGWMQQAVASVESKLDTILGEEESTATPAARLNTQSVPVTRDSLEASRGGASTPSNDRLQARLAQAMARKASASKADSLVLPPDPSSPSPAEADPNINVDTNADVNDNAESTAPTAPPTEQTVNADSSGQDRGEREQTEPEQKQGQEASPSPDSASPQPVTQIITPAADVDDEAGKVSTSEKERDPVPQERSASRLSSHHARQSLSARPSAESGQTDATDIDAQLEQDKVVQEMSEEITGYIEKIDTLQAKLKYLASEAVQAAQQAAASAQNGTAEKKLLEKDVQITLLMEEGQTLSKNEMKHLQTIKKIRQQYLASTKEHEQTRARADKAERSLRIMEDKARRAEAAAKRAEQNLASSLNNANEFAAIKKERDALDATLADIKAQLSRANARAEAAESKAGAEQLERERKRIAELQDDLTSSKIERELAEEKLRREIKDLRSSLEREKEHSRLIEAEMLGEQATLESKLESFRSRAEEVSSSTQGSVQAKLLRQIETLQNQYSAASQNWQRIEGSLLARITALEKERDEIAARESDVRRKVREVTLKARKAETEIEESHTRLAELEKSQIEAEEETHRADRKIRQLEADLTKVQQELQDQKAQAQKDLNAQLEEERAKWAATVQAPRLESPVATLRRGSSLALDLTASPLERAVSRRTSHLAIREQFTPPRQQSTASLKGLSNGAIAEAPFPISSNDPDEYYNNFPQTPISHSHAFSGQAGPDLVSNSTVAAGPSVQLVERLSSNVRRLESEKAASKDEIIRLTTQRDEARQEVVDLVREVDAKKKVDERLAELEAQHQELRQRYQTTLELLGEKSEQVEELKADIVDVKAMYRQLADTIGKA